MFKRRRPEKPQNLELSFGEFAEIGATGPQRLQFVFAAEGHCVTVKLSAEEARWLAHALTYWAESSETIGLQ